MVTTHYSVIAHIDKTKEELIIIDPYKDFVDQNRIIKTGTFEKRWWDHNEVRDLETGTLISRKDEQLFFVVTPLDVAFPEKLQMESFH
ncbi:MAG: hypothetical protein ABI621_07540 [Chloroflexota bacterium]